jgi:choline dehydrogenase-like flavoprotein
MEEVDHIIVGGGSAGATLAARLSEGGRLRIALLEAGGTGTSLFVRMPAAVVAVLPGWVPGLNWAFRTEPQPGLQGRRGYQPRGRALGGSSAINAMLYIRGHRDDYDGWAAMGCTGWDWAHVLPYFRRAEDNARGADAWHGSGGPLQVADQAAPRPMSRAFVAAAAAAGLPPRDDFNTGETEGAGLYQVTQTHRGPRRGERCSAAAAYLAPAARRPNLAILTGAEVTGITFAGRRATGVTFRQGGAARALRARGEVILAAGAFGSPKLLQLAGIGRAEDLRPHGIALRHALPGVGGNLHDHLDVTLACRSPDRDSFGIGPGAAVRQAREAWRWLRGRPGLMATPFAEGAGFLRSYPDAPRPDLQLHFCIAIVDDHARRLHWGHGLSLHVCALAPRSRGRVTLRSADPRAAPRIDPNFLGDPEDLATLIRGARAAQAILAAPPLAPHRGRWLWGLHDAMADAEWERFIRARADTIYHPVGTCAMGRGALAVVDPECRVHGVEGLRVVDASVFPVIPGGNTNAPAIMLAERAADLILGRAPLPPDPV